MDETPHMRLWLSIIVAVTLLAATIIAASSGSESRAAPARELEESRKFMTIAGVIAPEPKASEGDLLDREGTYEINLFGADRPENELHQMMQYYIRKTPATLEALSLKREAAACNAFLASKGSPLEGQGELLVREGRAAGIDWRLVVAVSGKETSWGKTCGSLSYSHNAWGWMAGRNQESWETAIPGYYRFLNQYFGHPTSPYELRGYAASNHPWMEDVAANLAAIRELETSYHWEGN